MEDGWIKIYPHRLLEWEWYDDANMFRLFMHLLLKANYKDKQWHGTTIKRGQMVTSLANLSIETGLSIKKIRICLDKLIRTGEICKQTASKFTLITVCKYCKYQAVQLDEGQANGKQTASKRQATGKQTGKQTATTSETKNNRKKEIIKTSTNVDAKRPSFVEPAFEELFSLWLEYKHQRKESYKSDASLKACYNRLVKLSGGDPVTALAIVEQSMANNWAGLFPLKNENDATETDNNGGDPRRQERANLARDYAATISRRLAEDDARAEALRKP